MKNLLLLIFLTVYSFLSYSQTLIMNEVSQGVTGNMEYVEFVVVDNTATYDCASGQPPTIDIRGWIFDDNSGYHGAGGIAAGCIRFSFDPLWSAVPMGTIILIYNDATPDPSIPAADISLADGNCTIVAPISDVNLFESNSTTPGAVACSYPAAGWTPGGNWSNVLLANTGDCARIVNLAGCEVFSVCYSSCNVNTLIYFANGAELAADHRNSVYYFNDGDPNAQVNWSIGCTDNELVLDANQCGSNEQTPGAPNNALNAAFIAQFNNGCTPIPPLVANAMIDNHEICGCDGSATATPSGSIPGYTYEWFDASMTPIGQTNITATGLCAGDYYVEITSSIGCQEIAMITVNPGSGLPTVTAVTGGNTYCTGDVVANITADVTGLGPWDVTYIVDGGAPQTASGASTPIVLGNGPGVYVVTNVTDANCTNTASGTQTITINTLPTVTSVSGGDIYCAGDVILDITAAVTGNGPWDVTYTIDGGAPQTASGAASPIVLGNGPGVYVVTNVTDANCTNTASGTQTITINTLPTVTAVNGGASYCPGDTPTNITVDVTGAPSWTVTYTIDGGAPQTAIGSTSPFALDDLPGVYVVTAVTDANCANTASGTQTITMNPTPVITLTPADPNACNATDGSVLVSGTGSGTVTWSGQASGTDADATLNYTIPNLGAGNYSVYFIDGATGCQSATESTSLNNPGAPVLNNPGPQTACDSYALPVITGTGLVNESYWTGTGGTGTQLSVGSAITSTQTVYIYDVNGSCSDEESFVVTINNTPAITNPGDQTACSSYTLGAISGTNISAGAAYYDDSQVNSGVQVTGPITSTQTVWIFDANGGCSDETSFIVTINPLPTVTGVNGSGTYCAGDAITDITAGVTGTGPWTVDYTLDGVAMSANGATSPVVLGNTAGTYVVTNVTDANCTNTASGTQTITVNPIPGAPTAGNDSTYCSSWTLAPMTATGGTGTMTWYDDAALTGVITTGGSLTPFDTDGTTVYYVTETAVGCEGPASMVTITIQNCEITIPTAITPNADGVHDDWELYGLDAAYPNNVVRIYNRWGGLLYEHDSSVDGPYDSNRWKGDYNGEALPVGSYYYIIDLNDEDKKVESGAVSILLEK
ncbi:MAG: gliding motility-associated C-terminal domain-containing protein [Bacteroidetes bacterium]|nr:MAG: gliding motility-associated C-terminal domain-containing protein [Bacteroidota bacterium]